MSLFFFKICSVSVIITSDMDEKRPDEQQILWMTSASSPAFPLESLVPWVLESLLCWRSNGFSMFWTFEHGSSIDRVSIVLGEGHLVDHVVGVRQSLRCGMDWSSRVSSVGAAFTDGGWIEYHVVEEIELDDQTIINCWRKSAILLA